MKKWFYGFFAFVIAVAFVFASPVITKPLFADDQPAGSKTDKTKKGKKGKKAEVKPPEENAPAKTTTQAPAKTGASSTSSDQPTTKTDGGKKKGTSKKKTTKTQNQ